MLFEYEMNSDEILCKMKIKSDELTDAQSFVIESWLTDDVIAPNDVLKEFEKAINSEGVFIPSSIGGNGFWREVGKEYTLITFQYEHCFADGKCPFKPCKVPTKLLYEILKVWAIEYEKWKKEKEEYMRNNPNYRPKILGSAKDLLSRKDEE